MLTSDDPLALVKQAIPQLGYGGDCTPVEIGYLALTSRVLKLRRGFMPVHLLYLAASSVGKSFTLNTALALLPPEAYHRIDAGSPRVLIYDDVDLQHRVVVFGEADSMPSGEDNPAASAIRNLLADGYLHYKVTVRDPETGRFTVATVSKEGPSVVITTAVRRPGQQLDTRLFTVEVNDDPKQIRAALSAQAAQELAGDTAPQDALIAFQGYLQALAPWDVVVPFADKLADYIGKQAPIPRLNRDFSRLLSLIKAVAVLRHQHRDRDTRGRLIAHIEDYGYVHSLVGAMYEATVTGASEKVREVVAAVAGLKESGVTPISVTALAKELGIGKMSVSRRVSAAIRQEWLKNLESRKGFPYSLDVGEPLPERVGLPDPDGLGNCNTVTGLSDGYRDTPQLPGPDPVLVGLGTSNLDVWEV